MMDIVHLMLGAVKNGARTCNPSWQPVNWQPVVGSRCPQLTLGARVAAFLMKTSDTVAVQMRLERVTESAGQFANTKCGSICDNKWNAIRPGYCVNDVGMVLQRGATRVPYVGDDGDLKYVISQLSFVCAFNDDPRIRYARALPNCFPLAKLDHQPRGRRLGGVGHVTAADLGGIKHLRTVTQNTQLMEAFEMLSEGAHTPLALWAAPLMTLLRVCPSRHQYRGSCFVFYGGLCGRHPARPVRPRAL